MSREKWSNPEIIFNEYQNGVNHKTTLCERGMYEQNRINERFYVGDQWYGVQCGDSKPLIRYNVIKRIGEYKMAMAAGSDLTVNFSAEGVACTDTTRQKTTQVKEMYRDNPDMAKETPLQADEQINLIMDILSDYFKVTAERIGFDDLKSMALRKSYVTGTGLLYTYWDDTVQTGQFADAGKTSPIVGDIRCEVLDVENVYFGDPTEMDLQKQPYIIIAQRRSVEELKREAYRNKRTKEEIGNIKPDDDTAYIAGDDERKSTDRERKATVLTKLYKEYSKDGLSHKIYAVRVVRGVTIRPKWDIRVKMYPLSCMRWETRSNCAYGDSEVTNLIPNQIAINRAATAAAHAVMMLGMPIMLYNADAIDANNITNDPGQIIPVAGVEDLKSAITYAAPPNFTPQFENLVNSTISQTLTQSGANDAALGDLRLDNATAFVALREAATVPLQLLKNRFYAFVETTARIWAEYWTRFYGVRSLKMEDEHGTWYMPFDAKQCENILINARVDVGPANLWSEIQTLQTLDGMLRGGHITFEQYLKRLPKGSVPDQTGLLREISELEGDPKEEVPLMETPAPEMGMGEDAGGIDQLLALLPEEDKQKIANMTPEEQAQLAEQLAMINE